LVAAVLAIVGAAVSYGTLRQQVREERARIDKLEAGLRAAEEAKHGVDLVQSEQRSFRTETGLRIDQVRDDVRHLGELWTAKFEWLDRRSPRPPSGRSGQG
jgi:hypothetical protein